MDYKSLIADVPDFPKPGILFKDITPIFNEPQAFEKLIEDMADLISTKFDFNKLALIESRGFLFGPSLSLKLGVPFVLIRKPGKLPRETTGVSYELEYGTDRLEVHKEDVGANDKVLIIDDLLATGGTASATENLILECGAQPSGVCCLIELGFLKGKKNLGSPFEALISF